MHFLDEKGETGASVGRHLRTKLLKIFLEGGPIRPFVVLDEAL